MTTWGSPPGAPSSKTLTVPSIAALVCASTIVPEIELDPVPPPVVPPVVPAVDPPVPDPLDPLPPVEPPVVVPPVLVPPLVVPPVPPVVEPLVVVPPVVVPPVVEPPVVVPLPVVPVPPGGGVPGVGFAWGVLLWLDPAPHPMDVKVQKRTTNAIRKNSERENREDFMVFNLKIGVTSGALSEKMSGSRTGLVRIATLVWDFFT